MKNEGWGFKEDQIPSSSHFYIKRWALNCIFIKCSQPTKYFKGL